MAQRITDELRAWIIQQAQAGCTPESVLQAMLKAGWQETVALAAMEEVMEAHVASLRASAGTRPAQRQGGASDAEAVGTSRGASPSTSRQVPVQPRSAGASARPYIDLSASPRAIDLGDRMVTVLVTMRQPRLVVLGNLLSEEECEALIRAAEPRLKRSRTVQTATGGRSSTPIAPVTGCSFVEGRPR